MSWSPRIFSPKWRSVWKGKELIVLWCGKKVSSSCFKDAFKLFMDSGSVSQASRSNTCTLDTSAAVTGQTSVALQNMDQKNPSQVRDSQTFLTREAIISLNANENNL